jgi:hypothetical protein
MHRLAHTLSGDVVLRAGDLSDTSTSIGDVSNMLDKMSGAATEIRVHVTLPDAWEGYLWSDSCWDKIYLIIIDTPRRSVDADGVGSFDQATTLMDV